ncbi:hypothetical protein I4U23_017148 [Adineta vaga]|nr:hypothetical protein I4U23_017148 [Adineta vaga]
MLINRLFLIYAYLHISIINTSHFFGGTITWRPSNNIPSGSTVSLIVRKRWSWRRDYYSPMCSSDTISAQSPMMGDFTSLSCLSGNCSYWTATTATQLYCTDFSIESDFSSGEYFYTTPIPFNLSFIVSFTGSSWMPSLVVGYSGSWSFRSRINTVLRPDGYINSSPVAIIDPIIYKQIGVQHVYTVRMSDYDLTDILRCRWATNQTSNTNGGDECGGVCLGVPGAVLISYNCTIVFTLTIASKYAAVALQLEDYYDSASLTPMSSIPIQFLFYGYSLSANCTTPPDIVGYRPNRACIGTLPGILVTGYIIARTYCPGTSIDQFLTISPIGMTKSNVTALNSTTYQITLAWTPNYSQSGPQVFCAIAVDNNYISSNQWCFTYLVNATTPGIISTRSYATQNVSRPRRTGINIYFHDANISAIVSTFDCSNASEITYTANTILVNFTTAPWISGHSYYVIFDPGI